MLTREENELLTRVGPGTAMGALMRRYWIPALLSSELPAPDGAPVRVRLAGENLVAWRSTDGKPGLLDPRCPHRGADLFFGRNEENGLRCVYHGWKFDIAGRCVDMPSEPDRNETASNFKHKVRATAYPCEERGGVIWAYLGPPEAKPDFPDLEWTRVPGSHRVTARRLQQSNWLQGYEGGWDTAHLPFLHRGDTEKDNRFFQRKGKDAALDLPTKYDMAVTDFGFVYGTGRAQGESTVWTVSVMFMPCWKQFRQFAGDARYTLLGWVPVDDENAMLWSIEYHPDRALREDELAHSGSFEYVRTELIPGTARPVRNRDNDYRVDRGLQSSGKSFTGIFGLALQDSSIQESMGPIADRTRERLMSTDRPIVLLRRELLRILKELGAGAPLPGLDPASYRVRPAVFTAPGERTMAQAMDEAIRIDSPALAK